MSAGDRFEPVIGLEVHAELLTASKIFCGCSASFGAPPNQHTCPVCLGMPGVLPVLNRRVVEFAIRAGLAIRCAIAPRSRWARKNYFYPDLAKGYQISQYELPICVGGHLDIVVDGVAKRVRLTRIHMEEDTGKNIHDAHGSESLVDFNRCGVPLLEIVSEPDLASPAEAGAYLRTLRTLVRYLEICDGNMEEGSFRCDANVSVRARGTTALGVKVEVKNMNSFRAVEKAIAYEIARHARVLEEGGTIVQETRLWDADREETRPMRSKESAHDYRYFPDPDLPPLVVSEALVAEVRRAMPELPDARRTRFVAALKLPEYDAEVLTSRRDLADYFEAVVAAHPNAKAVSNWVMGDVLRLLKERKLDDALTITDWPVAAAHLGELIALIDEGAISGKIAKTVFEEMGTSGGTPRAIVAARGLTQVSDEGPIVAAIDQVLAAHPDKVAEFRAGKDKLLGFFVGQVMKATAGKANPPLVNRLLTEKLRGE
ncbi:MAG: Asp-tRNA(Asn)/Glu-tRNA(Gln) amidotransferase subunit GatB [Deltaproteobacteria bacterium]|nr:Asp-tRNA(Asn)/Glu-tRNA(Gln) amidotransferase subunit GatB [Deltaproteobacteria bacterium]